MRTIRTLPIRVAPLPGEALDSWLEAISHRLQSAFYDTLVFLGLDPPNGLSIGRSWLTCLSRQDVEHLSIATAHPAHRIHQMTTTHLDNTGLLPRTDTPSDKTLVRWSHTGWSRYCPDCLAETGGRWQLQWRLGWVYACEQHRCVLVDTCPGCGKGQRNRIFPGELIPAPGLCAQPRAGAHGRLAKRCGTDLTAAPTTRFGDDNHPALTAQRTLHTAMTANHADFGIYRGHAVTAPELLHDLRALAGRLTSQSATQRLRQHLPKDLFTAYRKATRLRDAQSPRPAAAPGVRARLPATTAAAAITAACSILSQRDLVDAGRAMEQLDQRRKSNGRSLDWPVTGWARSTSAPLVAARLTGRAELLTPSEQLRYRIGSPPPTIPKLQAADTTAVARKIPAALWQDWALRLAAPSLDPARLAESLPAMLLVVNSRATFTDACIAFGSTATGRTIAHQLNKLAEDPNWSGIRAALIRLADHLNNEQVPIDYHRRRRLTYRTLLANNSWDDLCARLDIRTGGEKRLRVARCHLYSMISGNPLRQSPWFLDTTDFRAAVFQFPAVLTPGLQAALIAEAEKFLRHKRIDEPLGWSPSPSLITDLDLPGANPERLPIPQLHHLVRRQQPLGTIAATLGTTPEAIRHALTIAPAPQSRSGPTSKPAPALSELAATLTIDELRDLYANQKLSLQDIADRYAVSRHLVARLARRHAIPLRPPNGPSHHDDVDRDWLYTEYVLHRRTLPDLAAEKGMSTSNMSRWAKTHEIPLRGRGGLSHSATLAAQRSANHAPDILKPALRGIGGWERL